MEAQQSSDIHNGDNIDNIEHSDNIDSAHEPHLSSPHWQLHLLSL